MTDTVDEMTRGQTRPPRLPNFRRLLNDCPTIGRGRGTVVAAGGRIVHTGRRRTHTRWNNSEAAYGSTQQLRRTRRYACEVAQAAFRLRTAERVLADGERLLRELNKRRAEDGRSAIRLDHLRAWIGAHMPSVLAVAIKGSRLYVRFCAAAMRGAGERSRSPTRYMIPAMWVTVDLDSGTIISAFSDSLSNGAIHPHARIDSGNVCGGRAIRTPDRQPVLLDDLKKVLAEVELWRMCYGDDVFEPAKKLAGITWDAVACGRVSLAPIQGITGMVYGSVTELLCAEPWNGGPPDDWCDKCDTMFDACGCCPTCARSDCRCGRCCICGGDQNSCGCCGWCENRDSMWVYRGSANEHQVCGECGYCRVCGDGRTDCLQAGNWSNTLSFLTETDVARVTALATLDYGRRTVRPADYQESCDCPACRRHTEYLNSTQ